MSKNVTAIITDLSKLNDRSEEINPLVDAKEVEHIVHELKDTLLSHKDVVGLTASQIGYNKRIFCLKFSNNEIRAFVNPMITKSEGMHLSRETNASIPDKQFVMPRNNKIILVFQTVTGKVEQNIFEGAVSEIIQQMMQLLDGVSISDFGLEIIPAFDKASKKQQQEVIDWWLNQLHETTEKLNTEVENDPETLKVKKAMQFMEKVALGEIEIENVNLPKDDVKTDAV